MREQQCFQVDLPLAKAVHQKSRDRPSLAQSGSMTPQRPQMASPLLISDRSMLFSRRLPASPSFTKSSMSEGMEGILTNSSSSYSRETPMTLGPCMRTQAQEPAGLGATEGRSLPLMMGMMWSQEGRLLFQMVLSSRKERVRTSAAWSRWHSTRRVVQILSLLMQELILLRASL